MIDVHVRDYDESATAYCDWCGDEIFGKVYVHDQQDFCNEAHALHALKEGNCACCGEPAFSLSQGVCLDCWIRCESCGKRLWADINTIATEGTQHMPFCRDCGKDLEQ